MDCMNIVIYLLQHGINANAPTMRGSIWPLVPIRRTYAAP